LHMLKMRGSNLNVMTIALTSIVRCELLGLDKKFQVTYFGYVFSTACQCVRTNEKVCKNIRVFFHQDCLLVRFLKMYNMA